MSRSALHNLHNSDIKFFGVIPHCHFSLSGR